MKHITKEYLKVLTLVVALVTGMNLLLMKIQINLWIGYVPSIISGMWCFHLSRKRNVDAFFGVCSGILFGLVGVFFYYIFLRLRYKNITVTQQLEENYINE